ncbi:MAG: putative zinc-binding metallopeptidase [Acidimicrobiia bacterium]
MAFVDGPPCANAAVIDCSWVAPAAGELCASCALTRTTPDLADPVAVGAWSSAELQKRRLVLQLLQLGLPVVPFTDDPDHGMAFDLLYSTDGSITVGHADGVITIDVGEDDDARRARLRDRLGERYRTLLGHLRHEVGHFYFPMLVEATDAIESFRTLFGDERADYAAALEAHYAGTERDPAEWQDAYVSAYATAHPWEDWAESFAHVLHILGVLGVTDRFGLQLEGDRWAPTVDAPELPKTHASMPDILAAWVPLSVALNAINRAMGLDDIYPFVLGPTAREKLLFVYERIASVRPRCEVVPVPS